MLLFCQGEKRDEAKKGCCETSDRQLDYHGSIEYLCLTSPIMDVSPRYLHIPQLDRVGIPSASDKIPSI